MGDEMTDITTESEDKPVTLKDDEGDVFSIVGRQGSGIPVLCVWSEEDETENGLIRVKDALSLFDSHNLNTTANDLRTQLAEASRTIEALRNTVIEQNQDRSRVACLNGDKDKEIRALKYEAEILRNQMKLRDESRIETYRELCVARQELEEMSKP